MKFIARIAIAVVLLAAAGVGGWMYLAPSEARVEPSTVKVERGNVEQTVLATGALQAQAVTSVGAEVSGTIQRLSVKLGDTVKKGDLIAQIDSTNQQNAVKSAQAAMLNMQAQLQAKQADLTSAQAALARANKLAPQKLISDADVMSAQAGLASAEAAIASLNAQISQAQLAIDDANLALARTKITAPTDGTIVAVLVTEGQSVNANQTSPTIVKIADLDTMVIKAQISEADVTKVHPGQKVYFTILGDPSRRYYAVLRSRELTPAGGVLDPNAGSGPKGAIYYNALFDVPNEDGILLPAKTAEVHVVLGEAKNVLTVPSTALGPKGADGLYPVRVLGKDGAVSERRLKIGLNNSFIAEVRSTNLKAGEEVIIGEADKPAAAAAEPSKPLFGAAAAPGQ
jgi:macrolide-specific efflux system membrane fusion protein